MVGWNSIKWSLQLSGRTMSLQQHYAMSIGRAFQTSVPGDLSTNEKLHDTRFSHELCNKIQFPAQRSAGYGEQVLNPKACGVHGDHSCHLLSMVTLVKRKFPTVVLSFIIFKLIEQYHASAFLVICDQLKFPHVFFLTMMASWLDFKNFVSVFFLEWFS